MNDRWKRGKISVYLFSSNGVFNNALPSKSDQFISLNKNITKKKTFFITADAGGSAGMLGSKIAKEKK